LSSDYFQSLILNCTILLVLKLSVLILRISSLIAGYLAVIIYERMLIRGGIVNKNTW